MTLKFAKLVIYNARGEILSTVEKPLTYCWGDNPDIFEIVLDPDFKDNNRYASIHILKKDLDDLVKSAKKWKKKELAYQKGGRK